MVLLHSFFLMQTSKQMIKTRYFIRQIVSTFYLTNQLACICPSQSVQLPVSICPCYIIFLFDKSLILIALCEFFEFFERTFPTTSDIHSPLTTWPSLQFELIKPAGIMQRFQFYGDNCE